MEITEVRVTLCEPPVGATGSEGRAGAKRLRAYATLTFDQCFVVRNIKIIDGKTGLFVAMPSRKPKVACGRCGFKNDAGGRFCTQCGAAQLTLSRAEGPAVEAAEGHRDIAHPITADFRQYLQQKILEAYEAERAKVGGPTEGRMEGGHEAI